MDNGICIVCPARLRLPRATGPADVRSCNHDLGGGRSGKTLHRGGGDRKRRNRRIQHQPTGVTRDARAAQPHRRGLHPGSRLSRDRRVRVPTVRTLQPRGRHHDGAVSDGVCKCTQGQRVQRFPSRGGVSMRPAPPRRGGNAGAGSLAVAVACIAARSVANPAVIICATSRVICGAAILVPFIGKTDPVRVPAARTPCSAAESSATAVKSGPSRQAGTSGGVTMGPAPE